MSKRQRFRGLFVFVSAFFVMFSTVIYNNIMKAEVTIDDGPSGEKIVDIATGVANLAITEKGDSHV